jgi:hypothetical protein
MITLTWRGPKSLWPIDRSKSIIEDENAQRPGVYLWAVLVGNEYLANYVGISPTGVARRQKVHVENYLCGKCLIHSAERMRKGEKKTIYSPQNGLYEFLSNYQKLSMEIPQALEMLSVFFLPIEESTLVLKRIESSIIDTLRKQGSEKQPLLDNDRVSIRFNDPEPAQFIFPARIKGMPSIMGI